MDFRMALCLALLTLLCGCDPALAGLVPGERVVFRGGHVVGLGVADVVMEGGTIVFVGDSEVDEAARVVDVSGRWLAPAFIDSHVHLAYLPAQREMVAGGVAGAVDHASPLAFFDADVAPLELKMAGPMVTAVQGYPTQSWGAGGYGLECADPAAAEELSARVLSEPVAEEWLEATAAHAARAGLRRVSSRG